MGRALPVDPSPSILESSPIVAIIVFDSLSWQ
jgi:hypothetical protein